MIINGLPPATKRSEQWKEDLTEAFNQKASQLEFNQDIQVRKVTTVASYPTEVLLTVDHREGLLAEDLVHSMKKLQKEIIPGNTTSNLPQVSLSRDHMELVVPNLSLSSKARAQDAAGNICKQLGLIAGARPAKWLTQFCNRDGYQNKPTSLRSPVLMESLRRLDQAFPIPIPESKAKIFVYPRVDDKAYYMDGAGYTVTEARPSASPAPIKRWTMCTYCGRGNHEEAECYTKINDARRETARRNI